MPSFLPCSPLHARHLPPSLHFVVAFALALPQVVFVGGTSSFGKRAPASSNHRRRSPLLDAIAGSDRCVHLVRSRSFDIAIGKRSRGRGKKKTSASGRGLGKRESATADIADICARPPLPFAIGTRVSDTLGYGFDGTGTVTGHWIRQEAWPAHRAVRYRVRLDYDGHILFGYTAFQKSETSPIHATFNAGSRVECQPSNANKWFSGTVLSKNVCWAHKDSCPYVISFDYGRVRPV